MCVLKKGYQDTDTVLSSVTTKVKGIALTNTTELGERIWDVADYIIPPQVARRFDEEEVQAGRSKCPLTSLPGSTTFMGYEEDMAAPACSYFVAYCVHSLLKGCVQSLWISRVSWEISVGCNTFALMILVVFNLYRSKVIQTLVNIFPLTLETFLFSWWFYHRGCQIIKVESVQVILNTF